MSTRMLGRRVREGCSFSVAVWTVAQLLFAGCGGGDLGPARDARVDGRPARVDGGASGRDRGLVQGDATLGDDDAAAARVALLSIAGAPAVAFNAVVGGVADEQVISIDNGGDGAATALASTLSAPFSFKGGSYPGTGGSCGAALAAGGNCTVVVQFAPAAAGEQRGTLSLSHHDGQREQRAERALVGAAARPALLALSGAPSQSFGTAVVGAPVEHTFTLSNTGGSEASALAPSALGGSFAFKGAGYPGGGSCGARLAAGASCTMLVVYAPADAAAHGATLRLGYHDGAATQQVEVGLSGSGLTAAALSISDGARYDFGPRALGTSAEKTLTVSNGGGAAATRLSAEALGNGFSFKGGSYPGTGGTCGSTLAGLSSCTVVLTFAPAVPGEALATFSLLYATGAGNSGATRPLVGRGLSRAALVFDAGVGVDFGTVAGGARVERALALTNMGELTATAIAPAAGPATPFAYAGGNYPGSGGTCGTSLLPFGSCTLVVTYEAPASGSQVSVVSVGFHDGVEAKVAALQLRAAATGAAFLVLSDGPSYDFGAVGVGAQGVHGLTLANTGALAATGILPDALPAPFTLPGGYPGAGGDCGTTLAAGATCTIVVAFAPTTTGPSNALLTLHHHDGTATLATTRALSGTGTGDAALAFVDAPVRDFGRHAVGATRELALTVRNSGALATVGELRSTVALTSGFSFKGGAFPGTGGSCGPQLAAGASCTVVVGFAPAANGPASARLVLAYSTLAGADSAELALSGLGVAPAALSISDGPSFDFGTRTVESSTRKQLTVTNEGGVTATALAISGLAAPFAYVAGSCGATLDPAASCSFAVDYQPRATGDHGDTLLLGYSDGAATRQTTRALLGKATGPALLTLSDGPTLKFGSRATGSVNEATLTVTNGGASNATALSAAALGAPFAFKGGAYPGTGGTCAAALAPGAGCLVVVTFAPSSVGAFGATLTLDYHDGAAVRSAQRDLSGAGLPPARIELSASPGRDLGTQAIGATTTLVLSLRNTGGVAATGLSQGGLAAPFTLSDTGCAATLAAGESCQSTISFAPTALGEANAEVVVEFGDGVTTQEVRYALRGRGAAPALLTISDPPSYDFGALGLGTRAEHIFVVTNGGGVAATGLRAFDLTLPFAFKAGPYPGLGGSCADRVPAGGSCTVVVAFAPTAAVAATGDLALSYHDGVETTAAGRGLRGRGTERAALAITDYPQEYYQQYGLPVDGVVHDYGRRGIGRATAHAFVVTNSGAATATAISGAALSPGFAYAGGAGFPGQGGTCAASLAAGASCTLVAVFTPSAAASYASSLTLSYQDGEAARTATRQLAGTGVSTAVLTLADFDGGIVLGASYDYGTSGIARTTSHTFYLSNGGAAAATALAGTLSASFAFHGGSYPGTGGTCGATLAAGDHCLVVADFVPTAAGTVAGTLTIAYHDGDQAQSATRALRGSGTAGPLLVVAEEQGYPLPSSFDFGVAGVGRRLVRRFMVLNVGAQRASGVFLATSGAAFVHELLPAADAPTRSDDPPPCPAGAWEAGASCSVWVVFTPPAAGSHIGSLFANYGDGAGGTFTAARPLTGSGTAQALLEIVDYAERTEPQRDPHDFGTIGIGRAREFGFYLRNSGAQTATGLAVTGLAAPFSLPGGYPGYGAPVSAPACGVQLAAGASCGLVVRFTPSASVTSSATLLLQYHDGSVTRTAGRELVGAGTARGLVRIADYPDGWADDRPFDFGRRGQPLDHNFYLINDGAVAATLADGGMLAGDFAWKGGVFPGQGGTCGGSALDPGQQCTVVVTFSPTSDGPRSGRVGVRYTDASGDRDATRELGGEATSAAVIAIHQWEGQTGDTTSYDFGVVATPRDNTFFLVNIGRSATTIRNGAAPTGEFSYKGGTFPGTGGDCVDSATLAAGASCRIVVRFAPLGTVLRTSALRIDWGVAEQTTMQLTGTGTARGLIGITPYVGPPGGPARLDFGTTGVPLERTLYVHNQGLRDVDLSGSAPGGAFTYAGGAFPGTGGTCGTLAALNPEPCRLVVRYTPSGSGAVGAVLGVAYDDGSGVQTAYVELRGTATDRARLVVTEQSDPFGCGDDCGSFEFGNVATSADGSIAVARTLRVFNLGAVAATGLGPSASSPAGPHFRYAGGAFPGSGGTCSSSLAASATSACTIVVELAPRAEGPLSDRVALMADDGAGGSTQAGRNLRGSGTAP